MTVQATEQEKPGAFGRPGKPFVLAIHQADDGKYRGRLVHGHHVLMRSTKAYSSKASIKRAVQPILEAWNLSWPPIKLKDENEC